MQTPTRGQKVWSRPARGAWVEMPSIASRVVIVLVAVAPRKGRVG